MKRSKHKKGYYASLRKDRSPDPCQSNTPVSTPSYCNPPAGHPLCGLDMRYVDYSGEGDCTRVSISTRAYKTVVAETLSNGQNETGGVFLGNFDDGVWYIVESVDPGLKTVNSPVTFEYDPVYVNHQVKKLSGLYHHPLTILGVWHRHPGGMNYFSEQDMTSMASMVNDARVGLISMLVTINPELEMTFYYCNKAGEVMNVPYCIGDAHVRSDVLAYASNEEICRRTAGKPIRLKPPVGIPAKAARTKVPVSDVPSHTKSETRTTPPTEAFPVSRGRWTEVPLDANRDCIHTVFSDRAFRSILRETARFPHAETGGVLLGYEHNRIRYVLEAVPAGPHGTHDAASVLLDNEFINYQSDFLSGLYPVSLEILGVWHTTPASGVSLSRSDLSALEALCRDRPNGMLALLVEHNQAVRLNLYHGAADFTLCRIPLSIGDHYVPAPLNEVKAARTLESSDGTTLPVERGTLFDPALFPRVIPISDHF